MSSGGLSRARLGRMHDVMARHVDSPEPPGPFRDFWTSAYQAIDD